MKSTRSGHRWTSKEDDSLLRHVVEGDQSVEELMKKHGRTKFALGCRMNRLFFEKYQLTKEVMSLCTTIEEWKVHFPTAIRQDVLMLMYECFHSLTEKKSEKSLDSRLSSLEKRIENIEETLRKMITHQSKR